MGAGNVAPSVHMSRHILGFKPGWPAPFFILSAILLVFLAFRLWLTLGHDALLGVDGGAYLDGLRRTLGGDDLGVGFPRPPLAPGLLLWPFTELFGVDNGYKIWSSLFAVLPAFPVYLLSRRIHTQGSPSTPALFAAGFILLDILHAEMLVTGALPLGGFALLGMVWWAMGETEDWSFWKGMILAASLGLIPWVNQTTAGLAIITVPIYFMALIFFHSHIWEDYKPIPGEPPPSQSSLGVATNLLPFMVIGGIIGLFALPWYLDVLPVSGVLNYPGAFIYLSPWTDSSWVQLALALPLGLFVVYRAPEPWLKGLGVLICLFAILSPFLSTDETVINIFYRSRYLLAIPFYVAVSWVVFALVIPRFSRPVLRVAGAMAIGVIALMAIGYWWTFNNQTGYSDMVTRNTETALQIAREADNGKAIINNSFTLALWVAALNEVEAPHTWTWNPPTNWIETDRDVRCVLGWVPECDPVESIESLNAGWILIEKRFPYYNDRAPGVFGSLNVAEPWIDLPNIEWLELIYAEGTSELYRIGD